MMTNGLLSGMLRGIDVSSGSLGKSAKLGLGRPRTVANLPYPGELDVNVTRGAIPDCETDWSSNILTLLPDGELCCSGALLQPSAMEQGVFRFREAKLGAKIFLGGENRAATRRQCEPSAGVSYA